MRENNKTDISLSSILQDSLYSSSSSPPPELSEEKVKQALLQRPSFTVKARLIIIFLIFFLISAGISITAMLMLSEINDRIAFVALADSFANEIQHVRRIEKNYFLYGSDLSEALPLLKTANTMLDKASQDLGHVVGTKELHDIHTQLHQYRQLIQILINKKNDSLFLSSQEFTTTAQQLRERGSAILLMSLDMSQKERQVISDMTKKARKVHIFLLVILLLLSFFIAFHIYRHIILRLQRLSHATERFANGDFLPITPTRKYKDEFSRLVIAMNHMMYELNRRQNLLVESHKLRAIGNLTAGIAHELNNPLNNIMLTSEVLKDNLKSLSDEELVDIAHDLVTQSERAQQVVKNLLDFARESETKTAYFQITAIIDETLQLAKNQIKLNNIQLEKEYEKGLPPIYGDRELLKQVFLNLIINAIDAMPDGGKLTIKVFQDKNTGFISIHVKDTGVGIPAHILGSIFNPFFTTKPTGKGTGLGLAVSRGIIVKHGGNIEVKSTVNEGATFIVHLPIVSIPAHEKDISHEE